MSSRKDNHYFVIRKVGGAILRTMPSIHVVGGEDLRREVAGSVVALETAVAAAVVVVATTASAAAEVIARASEVEVTAGGHFDDRISSAAINRQASRLEPLSVITSEAINLLLVGLPSNYQGSYRVFTGANTQKILEAY
ncbi:hypothetical protein RUND412_005712 [Rhizina undulata]